MLDKLVYETCSILPKDLQKLKLELERRGFDVKSGLEMRKFLFYQKLSQVLYVSIPGINAEFHSRHGLLEVYKGGVYKNRGEERREELISLFFKEYRWVRK